LDDLEVPSLLYDDKPKTVLQPKAETDKRKQKYVSVKEEAENTKEILYSNTSLMVHERLIKLMILPLGNESIQL
jgi:hypothetical protein